MSWVFVNVWRTSNIANQLAAMGPPLNLTCGPGSYHLWLLAWYILVTEFANILLSGILSQDHAMSGGRRWRLSVLTLGGAIFSRASWCSSSLFAILEDELPCFQIHPCTSLIYQTLKLERGEKYTFPAGTEKRQRFKTEISHSKDTTKKGSKP